MLIMLTSPGVPDLYQGTELWSLQLVDPDNRRPVDFHMRRRALERLDELCPCAIRDRADDGLPKMWVIRQALRLRARRPEAFGADSTYTALPVDGALADRVVAFQRGTNVITVAPRLVLGAIDRWKEASLTLPTGSWRNVLAGKSISGAVTMAELWRDFPVALLEREVRS
jgi:(1->4)-alpha-D-glucan 1-alpha-D-glucosylmutase